MKIERIAAQLYTVRDHLKTPVEMSATLRRVRRIGYRAVQISGLGPIDPRELRRMLDNEGLVAAATHEPPDEILNNPQLCAERLTILGCRLTAYPFPKDVDFTSIAAIRALVKALVKAGKVFAKAGITLAYHNHAHEFFRIGGKTVLDHIYELSDPEYLKGEPDFYWIQAGGGNPVEWCAKLKGRLPAVHLKDYGVGADGRPVMKEIGGGNIDWQAVVKAAAKAGCFWYIVEQDRDWIGGDAFKSLETSFKYLKKSFCRETKK